MSETMERQTSTNNESEPSHNDIQAAISYAGEVVVPQVVDSGYDKDEDPVGNGV